MKVARIVLACLLVIAAFVTVDFGINFAYSLIPAAEGITARSVIHNIFGVFNNGSSSAASFLGAFQISLWITFAIFAINTLFLSISLYEKKKKNRYF